MKSSHSLIWCSTFRRFFLGLAEGCPHESPSASEACCNWRPSSWLPWPRLVWAKRGVCALRVGPSLVSAPASSALATLSSKFNAACALEPPHLVGNLRLTCLLQVGGRSLSLMLRSCSSTARTTQGLNRNGLSQNGCICHVLSVRCALRAQQNISQVMVRCEMTKKSEDCFLCDLHGHVVFLKSCRVRLAGNEKGKSTRQNIHVDVVGYRSVVEDDVVPHVKNSAVL